MKTHYMEIKEFIDPRHSVLRIASTDVPSCNKEDKIGKVIEQLLSEESSSLPVLDSGLFHGMVNSRDVLDYLGAGPKSRIFKNLNVTVKRIIPGGIPVLEKSHTIGTALEQFRKHKSEAMPIVKDKKIVGVVSGMDFLRPINKELGEPVRKIMSKPAIAREDWSVFDVAKLLCRGAFRRLPVTRKGVLVGVITADDIISYLSQTRNLERLQKESTPVGKIARTVEPVDPDEDVYNAVRELKRNGSGLLPVTEDGELVGVLTEQDIVGLFRTGYGN